MNRFLVMTMRRPEFDLAVVPLHRELLESLRAQGRNGLSGSFSDRGGVA